MTDDLRKMYDFATAELDPPFALVDLEAFYANADDLVRRANGTPIRLASKSVRVRSLLDQVLAKPGFRGVMGFSLPEAIWLVRHGIDDVLIGYPTVDRAALQELAADEELATRITLMIDDVAHLDYMTSVLGTDHAVLRVCIDIDTTWQPLGVHIGARRSPVRTPDQAVALARAIDGRPGFRLVGLMTYEAQIAGFPDLNAVVRWMKRRSGAEIAARRVEVVAAVRELVPLEFVNAGGTGSLELSRAGAEVTELTAGSGLFGPALFDGYRAFRPRPAAAFALPVVRRPGPRVATLYAGGYAASGPAGRSRLPRPYLPAGLTVTLTEAAGEVQTPVLGAAADELRIGDRVWMRHAKAGEMCERFDAVHLVSGDQLVATVPTYRGEGHTFG